MSESSTLMVWFQNPKNYRWIIPLMGVFVLLFLFRGCFRKEVVGGRYLIARDATWYPLSFYGKEQNVLGFSDDLIYQVSKLKKISISLVASNPGHLLEMFDDEKNLDGVLSSLQPDIVLDARYYFSDRYYDLGAVLVVKEDSPITSFTEMEGKYLGVKRGSNVLFTIPNHPMATVVSYDSVILMLDDILHNKIDGALMNQLNASNTTSAYYKGRLRVATPPLNKEGLRLITLNRPREIALIKAFNEALDELKKDGTYAELLKKWDLPNPN